MLPWTFVQREMFLKIVKSISEKAAEFQGNDIFPLHAIDATLVADMQEVIRYQQKLLAESAIAMRYVLEWHLPGENNMFASQTEAQLVTALAHIGDCDRRIIAGQFGAHHNSRHDYNMP